MTSLVFSYIASPSWEKEISADGLMDGDEKEEDFDFLVDQRGPGK